MDLLLKIRNNVVISHATCFAQSLSSLQQYTGIVDCFRRIVKDEGYHVLWRGLGTAVARAFVVNGAIFSSYEIALRCLFNNGSIQTENAI
ncbi:mitochondrial arginine transporter bac2 [Quercus suber]|uniref:Mitochondrial arginine transporter bac2 n=1 Tax=Quercus suber TaxID=58331 RepID=A0AAW0L0G9_QUESU